MDHKCEKCNKEYSSYKSLWNHTKKYHTSSVEVVLLKNDTLLLKNNPVLSKNESSLIKNNVCNYCNKELSDRTSRWRHEKKCTDKKINDIIILKEQTKIEHLEKQVTELTNIVTKLSKTNKTKSIINLNNNGTINIVNNINSLGYENIEKKLSEKEKINLVTSMRVKEHPIIELVRKIYTDDKFKEDRNTLITNLRAKDCLMYNSDTNKFDATARADHIDNIIENRRNNIVSIYNELSANNKLRPVEIKAIDSYLEEIEDLGKKNPKVKELYEKHKAEIIYIIYNSKEFVNLVNYVHLR